MNNITYGCEKGGCYETVGGGAGAGLHRFNYVIHTHVKKLYHYTL